LHGILDNCATDASPLQGYVFGNMDLRHPGERAGRQRYCVPVASAVVVQVLHACCCSVRMVGRCPGARGRNCTRAQNKGCEKSPGPVHNGGSSLFLAICRRRCYYGWKPVSIFFLIFFSREISGSVLSRHSECSLGHRHRQPLRFVCPRWIAPIA
jgi:hypothetical protein